MKNKNKTFFDRFYPTYVYGAVEDIPYNMLISEDIKLILLDMDNTLVDNNYKYTDALKEWTDHVSEMGITLHILSNSALGKKVKKVAKDLNMKYHYNASKPFKRGFKKVVEELGIDKENILMVGDQLFTDVWGGNRFGIKTALVSPRAEKEIFITKAKRPIERMILKKYYKRNGEI